MGSLLDALFNRGRKAQEGAAKKIDVDKVTKNRFAIEDAKKEIVAFEDNIRECRALQIDNQKTRETVKAEIAKYEGLLGTITARGKSLKNDDGTVKEGQQSALDKAREDAAKIGKEIDNRTKRLAVLDSEIAKGDILNEKLKTQLSNAKDKVAAADQNVATLAVRQKSAQMRQRFAAAESGLSNAKGLAALDDLGREVDMDESRAEAAEEMSNVGSTQKIEEEYAASSGSSHVKF